MVDDAGAAPSVPVKPVTDPLAGFTPATRAWFASAFESPTAVQQAAWAAIGAGECALVIAPTGSGKTLAAFLHAIDRLFDERTRDAAASAQHHAPKTQTRVLYISPIKALGADIQRNLRVPLHGVGAQRKRRGDPEVEVTVGMRTGDTPVSERASLARRPPDILITTPESLYLMLTSKARETLRGVRTVIVDEVHAVAGTKRGSHLALSLERLDLLLPQPAQRVGLSATVRPVDRVASFLGGARPVTVVNPPSERRLDVRIVVPVEDMTDLPAHAGNQPEAADGPAQVGSIWPHVEASILDRVLAARSTIVFANSRGLAEKLTARLNELYAERFADAAAGGGEQAMQYVSSSGGTSGRTAGVPALIARSHHGSVSKEQRADIERALKSGELRCVVATSSLELGIDMGLVELVIQVAAPPSVASALQRVGRAGHQVGGTSAGLIYPRTRRDLVDAAVTVESMLAGNIEAISPPRNPLDVLAQQTVAAVAMDPAGVDDWYATVRRAEPFRELPRSVFDATLDMLAGRYSSDEFAGFRPRLVWDRESGVLTARPGAQHLAVTSGGTIPDRGAFSVVLPEGEEQAGSRRVGELDEEMVYESRVNDVITLGATSWRILQITNDQVVVTPAPGRSARLPFWRGDGPGRPAELGETIGAFLRDIDADAASEGAGPSPRIEARLHGAGLEGNAIANLLGLVGEQRDATGALPTDRTLVVERCRDEVGDWRLLLHSPYGRRVHAPWALAISDRVRQRFGVDASVVAGDDGIIARLPDTDGRVPGAELFTFNADGMQRLVTDAVGTSALFAARFRECAARALLLPRRNPGRRSPLWQQRLRAGQLLDVARDHPDFPILVETARECLQDVYDLPALDALMRRLAAGAVRLVEVTTETPSPFAASLLFGYVDEFMYEGDAPLAERRASLLSLDSGLLGDLLGQVDLGELLDPTVVEQVEAELQRIAPERRVAGVEGVADLLRELGPLSAAEVVARMVPEGAGEEHLAALEAARRAIRVRIGAEERWAAVEDAARLRDALGVRLPAGIPAAFLEPVADPLRDLIARYARTHTPFTTGQAAARFGLGVSVADEALDRLREQGRVLRGSFGAARQSDGAGTQQSPLARHEWVWEEVFRRLRIRSLQAAREATRPVGQSAYVRQLLERQNVFIEAAGHAAPDAGMPAVAALQGSDGVARVAEQLAGLPLPASLWERHILPARVRDYSPGMLDELIATGEVFWSGHGRLGDEDGLVALHLRELAAETLPAGPDPDTAARLTPLQRAILTVLADGGAYFVRQIADLARARLASAGGAGEMTASDLHGALWGLVWAGCVTTDTWSTMRALTGFHASHRSRRTRTVHRRGGFHTSILAGAVDGAGVATLSDPTLAGRWSLLHREPISDTARALALVEGLLDRYGVVTRGAAVSEEVPGGFPALQRVFRSMEDAGRVLRGRFVEGLGAAQFADHATIDRLRELAEACPAASPAVALSAADPANPFGATLPWPAHASGMRPTRRAGGLVVIRDGRLVLWLAPGGRHLLTYADVGDPATPDTLVATGAALAATLKRARTASFTIETVDDQPVSAAPVALVLRAVGFSRLPKGLCWYG
ncbi:ATP-dependent helicase [Pseudochelatococcus lubricantis]|uniref:ATP-dependent helicase n=1 Tax=Pseudochelatococcus lubricantis TaxID=1538102 RepID=UPI0035E9F802